MALYGCMGVFFFAVSPRIFAGLPVAHVWSRIFAVWAWHGAYFAVRSC